ncbi:MAG: hypothetical protein AAF754_06960 [Pseudomonadota bacterium]
MDETVIYAHWSQARRALNALFPDYDYPIAPPDEGTFHNALEGLAVANDLTLSEVVETVLDKMMALEPEDVQHQTAA